MAFFAEKNIPNYVVSKLLNNDFLGVQYHYTCNVDLSSYCMHTVIQF